MLQEPENMGSATQADWIEISNLLRNRIKEKSQETTMSGGELYDLARAAHEVIVLETRSRCFDERLNRTWEQQ